MQKGLKRWQLFFIFFEKRRRLVISLPDITTFGLNTELHPYIESNKPVCAEQPSGTLKYVSVFKTCVMVNSALTVPEKLSRLKCLIEHKKGSATGLTVH